MKGTLQQRIAAAMWVMTAISTLTAAVLTGVLLVNSHRESIRQQLQATAASLVSLGITYFSELKDFEKLNRFIEDALQMDRIDKIVRVYDSSGKLIFTTAGTDYDKLPEKLGPTVKKPVFLTLHGVERRYESLVMPYQGEGSNKTFYLQVAIPLPRYLEVFEYLWWQTALMMMILIGISVILSHWLSRKFLAPVGVIAGHLEGMDPLKIENWKPLALDPEGGYLKSITDGVNALSARTKRAIMELRKMSRYVAHEMRTPLTIMQGEAETMLLKKEATASDYELVLRSSLEEVQRMSEIVNTVLSVGESSRLAPFHQPVAVDLAGYLLEHKPQWEKTFEKDLKFVLPASGACEVMADPKLLYRLIDNLVRNVKDHAPSSTCVVTLGKTETEIFMLVEDEGPGLSQNVVDSLNEDGGSSDAAGVGLNLCYRIAEISGISLHLSNRTEGGLQIRLGFKS